MAKKPTPRTTSVSVDAIMPGKMSAEDKRRQMKYMAEDAVRTLTRADEIKKDKTLMGHVKKHAREQVKTLQKVCK
jgi:hypothetical protein